MLFTGYPVVNFKITTSPGIHLFILLSPQSELNLNINFNTLYIMRQQTCTTVTLRQRPIRNGRISLYLDYYPAVRNP